MPNGWRGSGALAFKNVADTFVEFSKERKNQDGPCTCDVTQPGSPVHMHDTVSIPTHHWTLGTFSGWQWLLVRLGIGSHGRSRVASTKSGQPWKRTGSAAVRIPGCILWSVPHLVGAVDLLSCGSGEVQHHVRATLAVPLSPRANCWAFHATSAISCTRRGSTHCGRHCR